VERVSSQEHAADRARWLAELSAALDDARRLVKQLGADEGRIEAVELYARIEAARLQIQAMRLMEPVAERQLHPQWRENVPWKLSA
jgi:hypothetical protein